MPYVTTQVFRLKAEGSKLSRKARIDPMDYPAASCEVSSSVLARHSVLDTESSLAFWIPASAGMTNTRQAAGNEPPQWIQDLFGALYDHAWLTTKNLQPSVYLPMQYGRATSYPASEQIPPKRRAPTTKR